MLSVLIPVKDWNPCRLVESLATQLSRSGHPFEILISDDSTIAESAKISDQINKIPGATHFCREKPLGRSANRNFLGNQAKYDYLLFIDGDAGMSTDNFIDRYIDSLSPGTVVCGGTLYTENPPENPDNLLRWKYGRNREQSDASARNAKPWKSFSTFNFLIPANVFRSIFFDESIHGYGHEDTLFGFQLHKSGVKIRHINNGLLHLGLETASVYLEKICESGANLHRLYVNNQIPAGNVKDISLLATWQRMKKLHLTGLIGFWFRSRRKSLEMRLQSPDPSLLLLDLYKLGSISQFG